MFLCSWLVEAEAEKRPVLSLTDEESKPAVSVFGIFKQVSTPTSCPRKLVMHNEASDLFLITRVLSQIWVMALSVCFVFTITIGVFPAITVDVKTTVVEEGNGWSECVCTSLYPWSYWFSLLWERSCHIYSVSFTDTYFIPVSCFLLFNLMDWAGRTLTAVCMWVRMCVIIRLRRFKHVLWVLESDVASAFCIWPSPPGFSCNSCYSVIFLNILEEQSSENTVGKFLWKILHHLQEQFSQRKRCHSELMWLHLLCGRSYCFHTVTTGCQAPERTSTIESVLLKTSRDVNHTHLALCCSSSVSFMHFQSFFFMTTLIILLWLFE